MTELGADLGGVGVLVDGAGGAADEVAVRVCGRMLKGELFGVAGGGEAGGGEDGLELAGADDGVDLGDVLLDLVAVAFDQAAGDDEALGFAAVLRLCRTISRMVLTDSCLAESMKLQVLMTRISASSARG